jgi:hypothetical protein
MAITFERHNLRNQSSELHLFPAKSGWILQLQPAVQLPRRIPEVGKPSRNLSNSRKAMIILMKNAFRTNTDARGYQRTIEG